MKVIFISIDTLRADHLGCYGYHRNTSPNIDRLAKEGIVFENAYPSDVPTQPSFTSMFTGLRGIETGVVSHSETENLSERIPCFPEILAKNNVTTAAVSTLYMMRRWFARGYRCYMNPVAGQNSRLQQVDAEEINAMALPWMEENKDKDFFMFIHYWDPHNLYLPPEAYRRLFYQGDENDPEDHSLDKLKTQPIWPFVKMHLDAIKKGVTDIEYIEAQYDGEIRYTDDNIGGLLEFVEDSGISEETTIILTSDHGESLGEHDFYFDHHGVYETTVHVPLIIRHPEDGMEGARIKDMVQSTLSIAPTVLNLFGLEVTENMEGKNLIKIAKGEEEGDKEIHINTCIWTAKRAIRRGRWKLIKTIEKAFWDTPETELFDVESDPQEMSNLADSRPDEVDELELRMHRWLENKLGKKQDPLRVIVSTGLPVYDWVKRAAEKTGLAESYEEWRMRVDRGETR